MKALSLHVCIIARLAHEWIVELRSTLKKKAAAPTNMIGELCCSSWCSAVSSGALLTLLSWGARLPHLSLETQLPQWHLSSAARASLRVPRPSFPKPIPVDKCWDVGMWSCALMDVLMLLKHILVFKHAKTAVFLFKCTQCVWLNTPYVVKWKQECGKHLWASAVEVGHWKKYRAMANIKNV